MLAAYDGPIATSLRGARTYLKSCKDFACLSSLKHGNGANIVVISVEPTVLLSVGNDGARGTVDDVVPAWCLTNSLNDVRVFCPDAVLLGVAIALL